MSADPTPDADRIAELRRAVIEWQGKWTTGRAFHFLRARGVSNGQRSQARNDLKALHRLGLIVLNDDDPDQLFYTFNSWNEASR